MGFSSPFTNTGAGTSAGVAARNRLLGNTGGDTTGTATQKTSNPFVAAGQALGNRIRGMATPAVNTVAKAPEQTATTQAATGSQFPKIAQHTLVGQMINRVNPGYYSDTAETDPTTTYEEKILSPSEQAVKDASDAYYTNKNVFQTANDTDMSAGSDMKLYSDTLNDWMGKGDVATQNAVGAINSVDLDTAYGKSTADIIRSLAGQGDSLRRSTGASMATRGLAGSSAYNNAMNDVGANIGRQTASGLTSLFDTYMGKKQAQQQAVANIYGQQAANRYGTGQQAATSQVANKWNPLTQNTSFSNIMDLINRFAVQDDTATA
jgi:hypothetical protein